MLHCFDFTIFETCTRQQCSKNNKIIQKNVALFILTNHKIINILYTKGNQAGLFSLRESIVFQSNSTSSSSFGVFPLPVCGLPT